MIVFGITVLHIICHAVGNMALRKWDSLPIFRCRSFYGPWGCSGHRNPHWWSACVQRRHPWYALYIICHKGRIRKVYHLLYICLLKIHLYIYSPISSAYHIIIYSPYPDLYLDLYPISYRIISCVSLTVLLQFFSLSVVQVLRQLPSLSMAELLRSAWGVAAAERGGHDFWKAIQEAPGWLGTDMAQLDPMGCEISNGHGWTTVFGFGGWFW